jgi:PTS system mannose-specific IIB component
MPITLARVDDRVIHGQTITRWAGVYSLNAILVISDAVVQDELRMKVLKAAANPFKVGFYTVEQGPAALEKAKASKKNFFVISDNVDTFARLAELGGDFGKTLNIGNLSGTREGTKNLGNAICINDEDVAAFDALEKAGIDIQFQMIPDNAIKDWKSVKDKYEKA